MIRIRPEPNFDRFLDTLLLRKAYRRPPLFDFYVASEHKARVLGREVSVAPSDPYRGSLTPEDEVEFWRRAGYDYIQCTVGVPVTEFTTAHTVTRGDGASFEGDVGVIGSFDEFRSRRWSWQAAAEGDLSVMEPRLEWLSEVIKVLPAGMKLLVHNADVFTHAWQLLGFSNFCLLSLEDPDGIRDLMNSLAAAQLRCTQAAVEVAGKALGAVFYSDDIAYTESLMLSPDFFEEFLFPTIAEFARIGQSAGAPMIYHSDGRLYGVFDQLAAAGVNGIQPLEPKSMEPLEIKRRWPGKFCLMGNIDLDLMARGTPEQVEVHVRDRIDRLNDGGGYMPGISNTVPYYVKFENYQRMIETVYSYE